MFATDIDSNRQYGRHWHTTFGFGLMTRGGHRSLSGRGVVDARSGDVITTNPGEVRNVEFQQADILALHRRGLTRR